MGEISVKQLYILSFERGVHACQQWWVGTVPCGSRWDSVFPLQISRNSPNKPLSAFPPLVKQEGAPCTKLYYGLYFLTVTLLHCCTQSTAPPFHLPGPSFQGRTSAQPAGLSWIPVWHCSHFFSLHWMWAGEGSGKDFLVSCYPDLKDFSLLLCCIAGEEPEPESSLGAHPVLEHCTQQEKEMSI